MKPAANERFSAGSWLAVAPIRIEKLPAPAPAALNRPRVSISPHDDDMNGVSALPNASIKPPATSTCVGPCLSAMAPKTGCTAPQTNWPMASAKLMEAMPIPVLSWIGAMNRPVVWRTPMVSISMADAVSSRPQCMLGALCMVGGVFMRLLPVRARQGSDVPGHHAGVRFWHRHTRHRSVVARVANMAGRARCVCYHWR